MVPETLSDEQFKENENIVVYSGGCDSTLVLYEVCERAKKLGKRVYVLCIESADCDTPAKHYMEERARDTFIEYMRKRGVDIQKFQFNASLDIPDDYDFYESRNGGNPQATMWLSAITYLSGYTLKGWNVYMGYVSGDSTIRSIGDINNAFYYIKEVNLGCNNIDIVLPLQFRAKPWILEELHKHNIYKFTWYCEDPHDGVIKNGEKNYKPCNECHSCRTHIMALKEIDKTWSKLELRKLGVK